MSKKDEFEEIIEDWFEPIGKRIDELEENAKKKKDLKACQLDWDVLKERIEKLEEQREQFNWCGLRDDFQRELSELKKYVNSEGLKYYNLLKKQRKKEIKELKEKLGSEKELPKRETAFYEASHGINGKPNVANSKPPSFDDKPVKYTDCSGICGFCEIKETCTNPKRQKLRDKVSKRTREWLSHEKICHFCIKFDHKECPNNSRHIKYMRSCSAYEPIEIPIVRFDGEFLQYQDILYIPCTLHEKTIDLNSKILIKECIDNLRNGRHLKAAGVMMVCYYLKDHKKELEKWEKKLKDLW